MGKLNLKENMQAKEIEKPAQYVESPSYIKITSSDGKIFYVNKDVCQISKLLTTSLKSEMKEQQNPEEGIKVEITADILEICIKFMHYKTVNRKVSFERP